MFPTVRSAARTTFELAFANHSRVSRTACVFQTDSCVSMEDVRPLAWLVQGAAPTTEITFTWTLEYAFSCAHTGSLSTPGATFLPMQIWPANLTTTNEVTLLRWRETHMMLSQRRGPIPGALSIFVDRSVPPDEASVGIAVSRLPAYAIQAFPNTTITLVPRTPVFRIATGDFIAGQVLDECVLASSIVVPFAPDRESMRATLEKDGSWSIEHGDV
jgi:hypothetical protein